MFREIQNSDDSVAIFGSRWPCPTPFFAVGLFFKSCVLHIFALFEAVNKRIYILKRVRDDSGPEKKKRVSDFSYLINKK